MNTQYLTVLLLLSLTTVSCFKLQDILGNLRGKIDDVKEKLKERKINFRQALEDAKGNWMEIKDDLFDAAVSDFKIKFNTLNELQTKKGIFSKNLERAQNLTNKHKHASFGINSMSFMDFNEYKNKVLMKPVSIKDLPQGNTTLRNRRSKRSNPAVDLRERGTVGPIRDQQQCGSCWAFATAQTIETVYANLFAEQIDLSEQQFVDCDTEDAGCNGGFMDRAYQYSMANGISEESSYPYVSADGQCNVPEGKRVKTTAFVQFAPNDVKSMMDAIDRGHSLSVALRSGTEEFYSYTSGILDDASDCPDDSIDHAIVLVGYDTTSDPPYWIGRNQWGTGWGEEGYVKIKMGINYCMIESTPFTVFGVIPDE